jgi:hypothetical protein
MRTTLSLDDDVAALLERVREASGASLKDVVNAALREGLVKLSARPARPRRFRTKAVDCGKCYLPNLDNVSEALAAAEGESFK